MNLTEVRASRFGKGLFAVKKIPAHSVTCKATGIRLKFNETLRLAERESHCLQIGADQYIYCQPPFLYSNHSCEPNCGVNADLELFTLREILPGEELLWDYSTSMFERHWTMRCHCGCKECRHVITDFDLLPLHLQKKYLRMNIVFPFIKEVLLQREYAKV